MDGVEHEEKHLIQSVQVMEKMLFNTLYYICNIYVYMSINIYISSTVRILQDLKFKVPHNIQVS